LKYSELINFEPLETVVQLKTAGNKLKAEELVKQYVISEDMADKLNEVLIPQLQFLTHADNKGLLVIGNYGTGKSHLMAVISAVAEEEALAEKVSNKRVTCELKKIAGKFKVLRIEIGSTKMSLREIILEKIEKHLREFDISYAFPKAETVSGTKQAFEDMMSAFNKKFPEHGYLIVVDELLEFLESRHEQELVRDLTILREIGESCRDLRLRFIAGVQEAVFESPRFSFAAKSIQKVRDRFEQIMIAKSDVKFVVSERLLKKSVAQQIKIRTYLEPYARFYGDMNTKLEEFVRLFPVHPDYIDTFEKIKVVENRHALKSLSNSIKGILENEVPKNYPGVIAFDSYWKEIKSNPSLKNFDDIKEVIKASDVLEEKVSKAYTRPSYREIALRVVKALSVHRLTTGDIYKPLGVTPEELRDNLCLFHETVAELGGEPDADLLSLVETVLKEILKTVNGQFISFNQENRQYYLDLKKIEDYDAKIELRAETLEPSTLDRYYFDALKRLMECSDSTYVPHYKIWEHNIQWPSHQIFRKGYLFFGAPNERSTAVPARDFYIYFLPVFDPPKYKDEKKPDEIFLKLDKSDPDLLRIVNKYAASRELAGLSSGAAKDAYEEIADKALSGLVKWLQLNMYKKYELTYQGKAKTIDEWKRSEKIKQKDLDQSGGQLNVRDYVNAISGALFSKCFEELAPEYPVFTRTITEDNIVIAIEETLRQLAGSKPTQLSESVLDALDLIDGNQVNLEKSKYALYVLELMNQKGHGQVVNKNELLEAVRDVEYFVPSKYRLEPEMLIVVLAAMVYSGQLVLNITGDSFDATKMGLMAGRNLQDILNFKHISKPKDLNIPALNALFDMLNLNPGQVQMIIKNNNAEDAVKAMQGEIAKLIERDLKAIELLGKGNLNFWGKNVFADNEAVALNVALKELKEFLEDVKKFNVPGKLKNMNYQEEKLEQMAMEVKKLQALEEVQSIMIQLSGFESYLFKAEDKVPAESRWKSELQRLKIKMQQLISDEKARREANNIREILVTAKQLKDEYIKQYSELHAKARLGNTDDKRKASLLRDSRMKILEELSVIEILNKQELINLKEKLGTKIKSCFNLLEKDLEGSVLCPHCQYNPVLEPVSQTAAMMLTGIDAEMDKILEKWNNSLLDNLSDPSTKKILETGVIKTEYKKIITKYLKDRALPEKIEQEFLDAIKESLAGLVKVSISTDEIKTALSASGAPATPDEIKNKFSEFIDERLKGKDHGKIRIIVE